MKLMKIIDDETFVETDQLWIDGYDVGDRLLEGLPIKITLSDDKQSLQVTAEWPNGIDVGYWTEMTLSHIKDADCFSLTAELADDAGFIDFEITSD